MSIGMGIALAALCIALCGMVVGFFWAATQ